MSTYVQTKVHMSINHVSVINKINVEAQQVKLGLGI